MSTTTITKTTARATGAWYLGLGVTGMLGFLVIRPHLYVDDPAQTLANLAGDQALAHVGVGLEMLIVVTQALAAVWFYKLLRPLNPVAAFATATFGLMNAAAIMASGAFMATAVAVAGDPSMLGGADAVGTVATLQHLSESAWGMGNLFFGLWLIPMGWAAATSGRFPRVLGWLLIAGGVGYVLSGVVGYGIDAAPSWLAESLAIPATAGEFWMIGYLLILGIRPATATTHPPAIAGEGAASTTARADR